MLSADDDGFVDHLAVHGDDARALGLSLLDGGQNLQSLLDVLLLRSKHLVDDFNLTRVDNRLTVEAQSLDEFHLPTEGIHVVQIRVHSVQRVDAGSTCSHDNHLASLQQFNAEVGVVALCALCLQVGAVVLGTECDTHHALRSCCDGICIHDAQCAFNGSHDLRAAHAAQLRLPLQDFFLHLAHLVGGFGLRHTDDVDAGFHHGLHVLLSVGSVQGVDTNHHLGITIVDGFQCVIHQQACGVLLGHCHRVFQIKHDGIRTVDVCVCHHSGVVTRNEHHSSSKSFHDMSVFNDRLLIMPTHPYQLRVRQLLSRGHGWCSREHPCRWPSREHRGCPVLQGFR